MMLVLFSSTTNVLQFIGILLASLFVAVLSQLIYKKFSDQKAIKEMNDRIKELRKEMKGLKDPDRLMKLNSELLKLNGDKMKMSTKPMLYSSAVFLGLFYVWGNLFKGFNLFIFSKPLPIIGTDFGWLVTYLVASTIMSLIVRKKMGVQL